MPCPVDTWEELVCKRVQRTPGRTMFFRKFALHSACFRRTRPNYLPHSGPGVSADMYLAVRGCQPRAVYAATVSASFNRFQQIPTDSNRCQPPRSQLKHSLHWIIYLFLPPSLPLSWLCREAKNAELTSQLQSDGESLELLRWVRGQGAVSSH